MKQEVARTKKDKGGWALDEVVYDTEVTRDVISNDDGRIENIKLQTPTEGVLIHGLFLEGGGWNKSEKRLEDSEPKQLYCTFPIMHVTAAFQPRNVKENERNPMGGGASKFKTDIATKIKTWYDCPIYKYPRRSDRYLIFRTYLKPEGQNAVAPATKGMTPANKWKLCGVALICCKE